MNFSTSSNKLVLVGVASTMASVQCAPAQTQWPLPPPLVAKGERQGLQSFVYAKALPNNVWPDAAMQTGKAPAPLGGFIVQAGIAGLEPRTTYIMLTRLSAEQEGAVLKKESAFYWAPAIIGLTSPFWSPNGRVLAFREGFRAPERGDSSAVVLWNLLSGTIEHLKFNPQSKPIYWPLLQWSPGSRYLSYLRGGSAHGDFDSWSTPYELFAYDTKNKKELKIAQNNELFWSWTTQGTVLTSQQTLPPNNIGLYSPAAPKRDPLYEINVATLKKEKLVEQGAFPYPSPNNQWVAFFNWPGHLSDPSTDSTSPKRGFYLWRRSDRKVFFVSSLRLTRPPLVQWSPNSKSLFVFDLQSDSDSNPSIVYKFDGLTELAHTKEPKAKPHWHRWLTLPASPNVPAYSLKGTSPDGRFLFVELKEFSQESNGPLQGAVRCDYKLSALDTQTASFFPIATDRSLGEPDHWEWREDSAPPPFQLQTTRVETTLPTWNSMANNPQTKSGGKRKRG